MRRALPLSLFSLSGLAMAVTLPYQGLLTDSKNNPVTDQKYTLDIKVYSSATGGEPLWAETQNPITNKGLFSVDLGINKPIPDALLMHDSLFLGLSVAGKPELTPRTRLGAVMRSILATYADTAKYARNALGLVDTASFRAGLGSKVDTASLTAGLGGKVDTANLTTFRNQSVSRAGDVMNGDLVVGGGRFRLYPEITYGAIYGDQVSTPDAGNYSFVWKRDGTESWLRAGSRYFGLRATENAPRYFDGTAEYTAWHSGNLTGSTLPGGPYISNDTSGIRDWTTSAFPNTTPVAGIKSQGASDYGSLAFMRRDVPNSTSSVLDIHTDGVLNSWGADGGIQTNSITRIDANGNGIFSDITASNATITGDFASSSEYSPKYRVASSTTDTVNGAPWYGLGYSSLFNANSEGGLVQLAGYWGLNFATASNSSAFRISGGSDAYGATFSVPLNGISASFSTSSTAGNSQISTSIGNHDYAWFGKTGNNGGATTPYTGVITDGANTIIGANSAGQVGLWVGTGDGAGETQNFVAINGKNTSNVNLHIIPSSNLIFGTEAGIGLHGDGYNLKLNTTTQSNTSTGLLPPTTNTSTNPIIGRSDFRFYGVYAGIGDFSNAIKTNFVYANTLNLNGNELNATSGEIFNNITNAKNDNATLFNTLGTAASIRHALDFKWYDSHWQIGNVRSGDTKSLGFGITNGNSDIRILVGPSTTTVYGNLVATGTVTALTKGSSVPDYVFEPEYRLAPLSEVEAYTKEHKHLPEIPSATEIEKGGLDLAQMNLLLLKKVEELTLHAIAQEKRLQAMEEQLKSLR